MHGCQNSKMLLKIDFETPLILNLIDRTNKDSEETYEVVSSFIRGWLKKHSTYKPRNGTTKQTLLYGEMMLVLSRMVNVLNATSRHEKDSLMKAYEKHIR